MINHQENEWTCTLKEICVFLGKSRDAVGDYDRYLFGNANINRHRNYSEDELEESRKRPRKKYSKKIYNYQDFYKIYLMSTLVDMGIPMREVYKKLKDTGNDYFAITEYFLQVLWEKKEVIEKAILMASNIMVSGINYPIPKEFIDELFVPTEKTTTQIMEESIRNSKLYKEYYSAVEQWEFFKLSAENKTKVVNDILKMVTRYIEIKGQIGVGTNSDLMKESQTIVERIWKYYLTFFYCGKYSYQYFMKLMSENDNFSVNFRKLFEKKFHLEFHLIVSLLSIIRIKIDEMLDTKLLECLHAMENLINNNKTQSIIESLCMSENSNEILSFIESFYSMVLSKLNGGYSILELMDSGGNESGIEAADKELGRFLNISEPIIKIIEMVKKYKMIWYWAMDAMLYEKMSSLFGSVDKVIDSDGKKIIETWLSNNTEAKKGISDMVINVFFHVWDSVTSDMIFRLMENEHDIPMIEF